jgi:hypothetical protein
MSKQKLAIKKDLGVMPKHKFDECKLAYATEAHHKFGGNLSRIYGDPPKLKSADIDDINNFWNSVKDSVETTKELSEHLCVLDSYDEENYYGSWVTGIGFFNVRFPKETTRSLTEEELKEIDDMNFRINDQPSWNLKGHKLL